MTQADVNRETELRPRDARRADSERVIRKFALSAAIQVAKPGTDPGDVIEAARSFAHYILTDEAAP
jgi:hypothetical protein